MRVSYLLSFETYKKLQPPFEAIEPVGRVLFFFLYLVTIEVGVGVTMLSGQLYSLLRHLPAPEAGWFASAEIFGFGASLLAGVWVFRRLSARRAVREHDEFLRESYARLHCRDRRFVETSEESLVFGCDCKTDADTNHPPQPAPMGIHQYLGHRQFLGAAAFGMRNATYASLEDKQLNRNPVDTAESWCSDEIGASLAIASHHPASRLDVKVVVRRLIRTEPDPVLFEIPAGYHVIERQANQ